MTPILQLTDSPFHPEAYEALSASALNRAFWLNEAIHAVKYESIHGAPDGLTPELSTQRSALLSIPLGILTKARNREMDAACALWQTYRRSTA